MNINKHYDIDVSIDILKARINDFKENIAPPLSKDIIDFLTGETAPEEWSKVKKVIFEDIKKLFEEKKDIKYFYSQMDGFEYNAATIYGFSQTEVSELLWSNIYLRNFYFRENDTFVDPDLAKNIVIGEDSISYFVYDAVNKTFEVRDRIATDFSVKTYNKFNELLEYIINTTEL